MRCITFAVVIFQQGLYAFSLSVGDESARYITFCAGMAYAETLALILVVFLYLASGNKAHFLLLD